MALKDLKLLDLGDRGSNKLQENVRNFVRQFNKATSDGAILSEITVNTTQTLVSHGLGRAFQGWHIVDIEGDARVWRDTSYTLNKDKYLPLKASASVRVKIWVY